MTECSSCGEPLDMTPGAGCDPTAQRDHEPPRPREIERVGGRLFVRGEPLPDGPWNDEPDHVAFRHDGVPCIIHRNWMGLWCGYAAVPPGHPWHGLSDVPADVHGGVTYTGPCQGGALCHTPEPGEPDDVWWIGFDCGHCGDLMPFMRIADFDIGHANLETYRDVGFVRRETERLAGQFRAATP